MILAFLIAFFFCLAAHTHTVSLHTHTHYTRARISVSLHTHTHYTRARIQPDPGPGSGWMTRFLQRNRARGPATKASCPGARVRLDDSRRGSDERGRHGRHGGQGAVRVQAGTDPSHIPYPPLPSLLGGQVLPGTHGP